MSDAQRIVEALEELSVAADVDAESTGDEWDIAYACAMSAALSKAQAIAEGF